MRDNLGQTSLRRRKRSGDIMREFDALPEPIRRWVANAVLPWSPASVRKAWNKARSKGLNEEQAIDFLSQCEAGTLRKENTGSQNLN